MADKDRTGTTCRWTEGQPRPKYVAYNGSIMIGGHTRSQLGKFLDFYEGMPVCPELHNAYCDWMDAAGTADVSLKYESFRKHFYQWRTARKTSEERAPASEADQHTGRSDSG